MNDINPGDTVRLAAAFVDADGAAADPSSVTLTVSHDGVSWSKADADLTHDGTGAYHYDYVCPARGRYIYEWVGTGAVAAAGQAWFHCFDVLT